MNLMQRGSIHHCFGCGDAMPITAFIAGVMVERLTHTTAV
jgi:hypothetical protein